MLIFRFLRLLPFYPKIWILHFGKKLIAAVNESESDNIIILHGSDTLAYTSSLLANMFYDKNIVITASDKPIEDKTANGISNFNSALRQVLKNQKGVFVSYNGIFSANEICKRRLFG